MKSSNSGGRSASRFHSEGDVVVTQGMPLPPASLLFLIHPTISGPAALVITGREKGLTVTGSTLLLSLR